MLEGEREARRVLISFLRADLEDFSARAAMAGSELGFGGGGLMMWERDLDMGVNEL